MHVHGEPVGALGSPLSQTANISSAAMSLPSRSVSGFSSGSPSSASAPIPSFTALTYNILAKSLGTCAIPWVLPHPSPSLLHRIESSSKGGRSWDELKNGPVKEEYLRHFHKNFDSGNYAAMRGFWAATRLMGQADVPGELHGLEWAGEEDRVSYRRGSAEVEEGVDVGEDAEVATTLRGVLGRELSEDTALDLFEEISSREEGVYRWDVRGPRIFRAATSITSNKDRKDDTETRPHLIALQEYDVHSVVADYRGLGDSVSGEGETFASAMAAAGYDGAFFKDPLRGRTPPSGLGIFWRRDTFAPALLASPPSDEAETIMVELEPDESALDGCLHNADLRETWHPTKSESIFESEVSVPTLMPPADRRNAALARLRHLPTGRTVLACAVHLMTTSRDSAKTNWYPGEVRAGELASLGKLVQERRKASDEVLLLGDFNTDALGGEAGTVPDVFRGHIRRAASSSSTATAPPDEVLEVDTGLDPTSGSFSWGDSQVRDAFSDVHRWGDAVASGGEAACQPCTSKNADRTEWIDYALCSTGLVAAERSNCEAPKGKMPNEADPSDHLPLWATLEFV